MGSEITCYDNKDKSYFITVQEFIDENYAIKIYRNECDVFLYDCSKEQMKYTVPIDMIDVGDDMLFIIEKPQKGGGFGIHGGKLTSQLLVCPK